MDNRSILFVEGDSSFRTLASRELGRAGFLVEKAGDLTEARRAPARQSFDLVSLDECIPEGAGLDLLSEIREQWPGTQVVILSASGMVEAANLAMKQGAYGVRARRSAACSRWRTVARSSWTRSANSPPRFRRAC